MTDVELYEPVPVSRDGQPTPEQLVLQFLSTRRSPHTRFNYGRDLGVHVLRPGAKEHGEPRPSKAPDWLTYCRSIGVDPLGGVRQTHIALWARAMEATGLAPTTVARKLSAVSSWYDWLAEEGAEIANPAKRLPRPVVDPDVSTTPGMTRQQALALAAAADSDPGPMGPRTRALATTLLYTGARASEVCGATLADLGMDRGHRVLWVTRKGGKRQALALPAPALERIDDYLASRADLERLPALQGEAGKTRWLFATIGGKAMRPADVWQLMRRLGKAAGLPPELVTHMGVHSMRHSFATLYLDAGGNLRDLQDAMGHKDPRTTRRYDRARNNLDRSPGYLLASYLAKETPND